MTDLTILTCNYNTPDLICNLIKSVKLHFTQLPKVVIVDTGTPTLDRIDGADYIVSENTTHGEGVNKGLEIIQTDYVLLIDSDVLVNKDILPIYETFKSRNFTLLGNVTGDRGGKQLYPRVDPWFCFICLKHLKRFNIKFFDPVRTRNSRIGGRIYDVGSTMFEDVVKNNLLVADANLEGEYFKHYEGMSWRVAKYDPTKPDTDIDFGGTHNNRSLYDYGILIQNEYNRDIEILNESK